MKIIFPRHVSTEKGKGNILNINRREKNKLSMKMSSNQWGRERKREFWRSDSPNCKHTRGCYYVLQGTRKTGMKGMVYIWLSKVIWFWLQPRTRNTFYKVTPHIYPSLFVYDDTQLSMKSYLSLLYTTYSDLFLKKWLGPTKLILQLIGCN